jgi:hypothetical protein
MYLSVLANKSNEKCFLLCRFFAYEKGKIMKEMRRGSRVVLLIGLAALCYLQRVQAVPRLVGIVNNGKHLEISVVDRDGKVKLDENGKPLMVSSGGVQQYAPVDIPDMRHVKSAANKWESPLTLKVKGDKKTEYVQLIVSEDNANGQLKVEAGRIDESGFQSGGAVPVDLQVAYITNAMNTGHIYGIGPNPWQGVFVAFKEEATDQGYSFAITSWASNRQEWINAGKNFLKTKQTVDGKVVFKDRDGNDRYLRIIQGQQAYGGGMVPRPLKAHLVHIYNNTNYALHIKRMQEDTNKADSIIIPSQSVIPYAMLWVPNRLFADEITEKKLAIPGISINLLSAQNKKKRPPRIGDYLYKAAAGLVDVPSTIDVDDIVKKMGFSASENLASVMGEPSAADLIKPSDADNKFYASKIEYKLWSRALSREMVLASRNMQEDEPEIKKISITSGTYIDNIHPGYFALIVTENRDNENPLKFTFVKMNAVENPNIAPARVK